MIEQHLKSIAEEYSFSFNHLNKVLLVDLNPPFSVTFKDNRLKFVGTLPLISDEKKEEFFLQFMKLNLALESTENLALGLVSDQGPCLVAEFCINLNYKQIKNQIESFANHLDKISAMIQDLNKKN